MDAGGERPIAEGGGLPRSGGGVERAPRRYICATWPSVTDSVINSKLAGWYGQKRRGVVINVYKQLDANVVETVDAVKAALARSGALAAALHPHGARV